MLADLPLALNRRDGLPMAVQLADALRSAAGQGTLRIGDRLPSTRALAVTLGVSRTVTAAAYDALAAEGWIGGRRGAGTYVIAAPAVPCFPVLAQRPPPRRRPRRRWKSTFGLVRRGWRACAR